MNAPSNILLQEYAPLGTWHEAIKQAKRSPHKRHKTGCVIFTKHREILSKGCSHTHNGGLKICSVHAEMDALSHLYRNNGEGLTAIVVTLTRNGHFARASKPCTDCARLLGGVCSNVIFAERANDESWVVFRCDPWNLSYLKPTRYSA